VLFGSALLFKPPTSPLTLALFVLALVSAAILDRLSVRTTRWKTLASSNLQVILPAVLIPLPHYLLTWRETWNYIYSPIFGESRSVWASHFPPLGHLLYYLRGEGGQVMLGAEIYPLTAIIPAGACLLVRHRQWTSFARFTAMAIATLAAFAIATCLPVKQPFFGTSFDWLLIFTAVYALRPILLAPVAHGY